MSLQQNTPITFLFARYLSVRTIGLYTLLLLALSACGPEKRDTLQFGGPAPVFETVALDGAPIRLTAMKGAPVILRFFVSNCKYCRADTKIFNDYYKKYGSAGLKIVYISSDSEVAGLTKFVEELGIVFPVVHDPKQRVAELYHVKVVPQTIILDPDHLVIGAILGGVSATELDDLLLKFL